MFEKNVPCIINTFSVQINTVLTHAKQLLKEKFRNITTTETTVIGSLIIFMR